MNIIHLLSQNHLTGAEVYAGQLIEAQTHAQKHVVYQISNGFFYPTSSEQIQLEVETKSKIQFINNIFWLREFIKKHQIHVIHSHSRAAAKLAYYATLFTGTAHVSTIHGIQHPSLSKKLLNQYGQFSIAVCTHVKTQLINHFRYNSTRIKVIPNPINSEMYRFEAQTTQTAAEIKMAVIGRSTGPKKDRTQLVLNALARLNLHFNWSLDLIGSEQEHFHIPKEISNRVRFVPHKLLTSEVYKNYHLVIGSGRVAMESLLTGCKTLAFGEADYCGLITEENFNRALASNFGDIHPERKKPKLDEKEFNDDLNKAAASLQNENKTALRLSQRAGLTFNLSEISKKIERVYESAYFLKNHSDWIPVLMYHKVPENELTSKHKIYVTKSAFEKHLQFFKNRGLTALTFSELALFRKAQLNFKNFPKKPFILTFDDGYRDNLTHASPLLKKYGYRAQLFLLADSGIDSNRWDQSPTEPPHEIISGEERALWKNSAFEIGSHGFSHRKLTEIPENEALAELAESKKALETELGISVTTYAFTYGITTDQSRELAERAGYEYAVNTDTGGLLIEEDPYAIFRVNIFPDETSWSLFKKTSRWYRRYYYFKRKK